MITQASNFFSNRSIPIGRFAPSPTGNLHLGSLITAVASYCIAKQQGGQWLIRIEDIDSERCQAGYSEQIVRDLARLGLHSDAPIRYQSQHLTTYHEVVDTLTPVSYGCDCSRKYIQQYTQLHNLPIQHYPQLCVHRHLARHHAIRVMMPVQQTLFFDQLQGIILGNPQLQHGDIIVRRRRMNKDSVGMINYMLAVVIDDAIQGVSHIVRGLDILPLTIPQLVLMDFLKLPLIKAYYHLPILVNQDGQKLSKQTLAEPIQGYKTHQLLQLALWLLKQKKVDNDTPERMLAQAVSQWCHAPLINQQTIACGRIDEMLFNMNKQSI